MSENIKVAGLRFCLAPVEPAGQCGLVTSRDGLKKGFPCVGLTVAVEPRQTGRIL